MKKLSFSHYLFFSVIAIYCVFVTSFLYYQYFDDVQRIPVRAFVGLHD